MRLGFRHWKGYLIGAALLASLGMQWASAAAAADGASLPPGGAVGALGRVEPQSGLVELGAGPGDRLLSLRVKAGDSVKKGQLLGTLSSYPEQLAARDEAAAQLAEAQARLKAQIALGEAQIAQAQSQTKNLDRQKPDLQIRIVRTGADEARAAIPIESLTRALAVAEARVTAAAIVAPIDGSVLDIGVHPGESIGDRPVLTIGNVDKMRVRAEVYETDIGRVRIGQTATIKSRALARTLTGHVVDIGHMVFKNSVVSSDPTARVDARIVEVWIALDDSSGLAGLSNLTVDVVINGVPAAAAPGGAAQAAGK